VIRFKCIYCGQRILAPDGGASKKGKCPKCSHLLVVPWTTKGRPAISSDKEPMPDRPKPRVPEWDKDLDLRSGPDGQAEDALIELFKESFGFLVPTYDKLSLFLMAVTLILLYLANGQTESTTYRTIFSLVLIFLVVLFSQLSTSRKTSDFKKKVMLFFAVLTNAITGIIAGIYLLSTSVFRWLLVFPIWNIINGVLMFLMVSLRVIDEECISDRKATVVDIILGLAAVLVIFIVCNYVFKLYWAITFSICIVYTTSFDRALQNIFPGPKYGENEQAA